MRWFKGATRDPVAYGNSAAEGKGVQLVLLLLRWWANPSALRACLRFSPPSAPAHMLTCLDPLRPQGPAAGVGAGGGAAASVEEPADGDGGGGGGRGRRSRRAPAGQGAEVSPTHLVGLQRMSYSNKWLATWMEPLCLPAACPFQNQRL